MPHAFQDHDVTSETDLVSEQDLTGVMQCQSKGVTQQGLVAMPQVVQSELQIVHMEQV